MGGVLHVLKHVLKHVLNHVLNRVLNHVLNHFTNLQGERRPGGKGRRASSARMCASALATCERSRGGQRGRNTQEGVGATAAGERREEAWRRGEEGRGLDCGAVAGEQLRAAGARGLRGLLGGLQRRLRRIAGYSRGADRRGPPRFWGAGNGVSSLSPWSIAGHSGRAAHARPPPRFRGEWRGAGSGLHGDDAVLHRRELQLQLLLLARVAPLGGASRLERCGLVLQGGTFSLNDKDH